MHRSFAAKSAAQDESAFAILVDLIDFLDLIGPELSAALSIP
jgi:hypothetical protein